MRYTLSCLIAAVLAAGCATAQARPPVSAPSAADTVPGAGAQPVGDRPTAHAGNVPDLPRPARASPDAAEFVEHWSPDLAAAIARLAAAPTVEHEVEVAQAYVRAGITDKAFEYFANAARLDPAEAAAWDGLARIWRDWGFPHFGLGDAYRAVHADPRSPATRNTLGTILQTLGHGRAAREQFAQALTVDAAAAYALNNLCYSWLMEADAVRAAEACGRALAIEPGLVPARNNLALATAVSGDLAGAADIFGAAGGEAAAQYNLGVVCLSQHRYSAAADAFERAARLRPAMELARERVRQARQSAVDAVEGGAAHERR